MISNISIKFRQFIKEVYPQEIPRSTILKTIKYTTALACTFAIPRFIRTCSPLPATSSLQLMKCMLISSLIYRAFYAMKQSYPSKMAAVDDLLNGCVDTASNLTLTTAIQLSYPYFFIHEGGHFLAAKAFFQETKKFPHKMTIHPFISGETTYAISLGMTKCGEFIGKDRALLATLSAGMGASTLFSCGNILLSNFLKDRCYGIGKYLRWQASAQTIQELVYQAGFFLFQNQSVHHDLAQLSQRFYIRPMYPLLGIAIAPVLMSAISQRYTQTT